MNLKHKYPCLPRQKANKAPSQGGKEEQRERIEDQAWSAKNQEKVTKVSKEQIMF
jgi:hypothetical protein